MEYIYGLNSFQSERPAAVTIGKFDGFHLGHQRLLEKVRSLSGSGDIASMVIAFDMIPFFRKNNCFLGVIMERSEKRAYLADKVDYFIDCPFDESVSETEAEDFVRDVLVRRLKARHLVVGEDFHFGKRRRGDVKLLAEMAQECGYELHVVPDVYRGKLKISSSYIRQDLKAGKITQVTELLGHPYQMFGKVSHGRSMGSSRFEMATINIEPDPVKALPPFGVYVVGAKIRDNVYQGVANLGVKPTVGALEKPDLEVHLIDFDQEVYGEDVVVSFYRFLRPEKKFDSLEALKEQMHQDLLEAQREWNR